MRRPPAPELLIRIKKASDGSAALTCVRADGSVTWQRQAGALGAVFPTHDLTHYAVERALGYRAGFFGLVADGWEISDFAHPWPRGPIPDEARLVELLVSVFQTESRAEGSWTAADFAEQGRLLAASGKRRDVPPLPALTDAQLDQVRALRAELFARWGAVRPGDALELPFDRGAAGT